MTPAFLVAVDQSTSATKALLFDSAARPVHRVTVEHRQYYPQAGWVEHDANEILHSTIDAVTRVVLESAVEKASLAALAITNQRETIVAWDAKSGEPVYRALVWQDERGADFCAQLKSDGAAETVQERTGLVIDSYFSASKLRWIVRNCEAAKDALRRGELLCGTVDSWLIWNLTGRKVFATDASNACRTLLFDINRLRWDEELLELFGAAGVRLPAVLPSDSDFGEAEIAPLALRLPIRSAMGDSHAALYGHAAFPRGAAKATYGTGSSIMMNVGTSPRRPPAGIVSSIGWSRGAETTYVFEGNINHSGDTVRWVRDNLGLFSEYAEAEDLAKGLASNGGVYLVPAFSGLGSPHWIHGIRAAITGMSRASGRAEIVRAALESIAYQILDVIQAMTAGEDFELPDLRVDGGATANRFLMQFQADLLGVPLRIASIEEVSARGVAFMAGARQGLWSGPEELAELAVPSQTCAPEMDSGVRARLIQGWHHAVRQTLLTD